MVKQATIRVLISIALRYEWILDVNNAFLNRTLQYEVFMRQPFGFIDEAHPKYVSFEEFIIWAQVGSTSLV